MELSKKQIEIIESSLDSSLFLSGPAGAGKSTAGVERLNFLVRNGIPGNRILLLFPQRTLSVTYQDAINYHQQTYTYKSSQKCRKKD